MSGWPPSRPIYSSHRECARCVRCRPGTPRPPRLHSSPARPSSRWTPTTSPACSPRFAWSGTRAVCRSARSGVCATSSGASQPFAPASRAGRWRASSRSSGSTRRSGVSGRPSFAVQWAELVGLDPDVLLVMPCGFELAAARADADACRAPLDAVAPRAVRSGRAYAVDATAHFSRPGPRVADGVELLAALLHPDVFPSASLEGRATVWA